MILNTAFGVDSTSADTRIHTSVILTGLVIGTVGVDLAFVGAARIGITEIALVARADAVGAGHPLDGISSAWVRVAGIARGLRDSVA